MDIEPDFTYLETELAENGIDGVKVEKFTEDRDGTPIPMLKFTRGLLEFTMNAELASYTNNASLIHELCRNLADDRVKELEIAKWLADEDICAAAKCTVHGDDTYISYGNQHVCHPTSIFGPNCQDIDRRMLRLEFKDVNEQLIPGYARFMPAWKTHQQKELYDRFGIAHGSNYVIYYKRLDNPEPTIVLTFNHNLKSDICVDGKLVTDHKISTQVYETVGPLPGGELVLTGIYVPFHPGEAGNISREFVFLGNVLASYGVRCVATPGKYAVSCEDQELATVLKTLVAARWDYIKSNRGWLQCVKEGAESARGFYTCDLDNPAAPIEATPFRTYFEDMFEMFPYREFVVPNNKTCATRMCPNYAERPKTMKELDREALAIRDLCETSRAYCRISLADLPNGSQEEILTVAIVKKLYSSARVNKLSGLAPEDKIQATYIISPMDGKEEQITVEYDLLGLRLMFGCEAVAKDDAKGFRNLTLIDILSEGEIRPPKENTGRKTVTVSFPPEMHEYVKTQGASAGNVSAYIQGLVEQDMSTSKEYCKMDEMTKTVIQKFMDLAERGPVNSVYWSAAKVRYDWIQLSFDNRSEFPKLLVSFQDLSVTDTGIPVEITWSLNMSPTDLISRKILYRPEDGKWMQEQAHRLLAKYDAFMSKVLAKTMDEYNNTTK
jgi:hypothetical protein